METQGKYRDIPYESDSELYFLFWYFELEDKHMAHSIRRGDPLTTAKGFTIDYPEVKKDKVVMKSQTILKPSVYTPDFVIIGLSHFEQMIEGARNVKMNGDEHGGTVSYDRHIISQRVNAPLISTYTFDFPITYVECKPDFDQNNMTRLFKINQKIIWEKHQLFINLVKTNEFFAKTFTPREYFKTKTGKPRKLNYEPRTLEQYLHDYEISQEEAKRTVGN